MKGIAEAELRSAYAIAKKEDRQEAVAKAKDKVLAALDRRRRGGCADPPEGRRSLQASREGHRPQQHPRHRPAHRRARSRHRAADRCEASVLPRTHGSALFTRGETQALVVTTLGTGEDEQYVDSLEGTYKETFMLHYNFPPFSVGETGRLGGAGRREIGHGKLAWRAIHPMLPPADQFPYTIRVVSEITEFERLVVDGDRSAAPRCRSWMRACR